MKNHTVRELLEDLLVGCARSRGLIDDNFPELSDATLAEDLETNVSIVVDALQTPDDLVVKRLRGQRAPAVALMYFEGLVDRHFVAEAVLGLALAGSVSDLDELADAVPQRTMKVTTIGQVVRAVLTGHAVILMDGSPRALTADTAAPPGRPVERAQTDASIVGPMDSFTETLRVNVALIRKRLKTSKLTVNRMVLGQRSHTEVRLLYVADTAPPELVQRVVRRLQAIDTDMVMAAGQVKELIVERPYSIFPLIEMTERPDTVAASLAEGRVAIAVDNDPFILLVPSSMFYAFGAVEDHYVHFYIAAALRLLRVLAFIVATFVTPLYVGVALFHPQLIPLPLLLNIAAAGLGTPFPLPLAAFGVEVVLEILREAGLRLPKQVATATSIVGAIVLGQAAIQSGFVSPVLLIVSALGAIASFAIPGYELSLGIRLLRFPILLMASCLGYFGVAFCAAALALHAGSLSVFGYPFFAFPRLLTKRPARARGTLRPYARLDTTRGAATRWQEEGRGNG